MEIEEFSYRYGKEILEHPKYNNLYKEITEACKSCPVFTYSGKSNKQASKDVVQQMINQYLKLKLAEHDWIPEPIIETREETGEEPINLKGDFIKDISIKGSDEKFSILIEVELGNGASCYRDLYKFQRALSNGKAKVCVLIVPDSDLAKRIDSGLGDFKKIRRELPSFLESITIPILVIGLKNDTKSELDLHNYMNNTDIVKKTDNVHTFLREIFLESVIRRKKQSYLNNVINMSNIESIQPLFEKINKVVKEKKEDAILQLKKEVISKLLEKS